MPVPSASPDRAIALEAARAAGVILKAETPDTFAKTARYLGPYALMLARDGQTVSSASLVAAATDTDQFFTTLSQGKTLTQENIDLDITYRRFLKTPPALPEKKRRRKKGDFFSSNNKYPQAPRCLDALRRGDEKAARKIIHRLPEDKRGYLVTKVLGMALDENLPAACSWLIRQNAGDFWHFRDNVKTACSNGRFESVNAILSLFKPDSFTRLIDEGYAVEWLEASYRNKDARVCKLLIEEFPVRQLPTFRLVSGMLEALKHGSEDTACDLIKPAIKRRLKLDSDNAWRLENEVLADRAEDFGVLYVRWFKQTFGHPPNGMLLKALELNCVNITAAIMDQGGDSNILLFEKDHGKLAQFINCANAWKAIHNHPVPAGYGICDPAFYNPALIKKIISLFDTHEHNIYGWAATVMAFNAAGLFQTAERLGKYMKRWGDNQAGEPLHDLIQMIKLPAAHNDAIDIKAWGDGVIECGPAMAKLVAFADRVPAPIRSADGRSWSLNATRAACAKFAYARGAEHAQLATLCITNGVTEERFDRALDLVNATKSHTSSIPDITLDGADFGLPNYRFYKLANDDIRGLFLGELTGCCQSIGAHGSDCAKHGFTSPHSGFYVIENNKGDVIGQCWAWRGEKGELCLDSLERLGNHITDDQWLALLKTFAAELEKQSTRHTVTALHVGLGGKTPKSLAAHFTTAAATPRDYNSYRDSHHQLVVAKISAPPAHAGGQGSRKAAPSGAG